MMKSKAVKLLNKGIIKGAELKTVKVPEEFEGIFLKAQEYVERYFTESRTDPNRGMIEISGERYILVRAGSMSKEFYELVVSLYHDRGKEEARNVAFSLLFDVAHAIGKADAKSFHRKMAVSKPIEKLSAGPIHFAYTGWAFVNIFPESHPTPDEDYYLIYDHPFSFEAHTWLQSGEKTDFPVCIMNAGYSSGWCEESFGIPLVAAEIECRAKGDDHCRFIMAPPERIEKYIQEYTKEHYRRTSIHVVPDIPEFFQRKRLEEELIKSEETVRALLNAPNDRALLLDRDGRILALNSTASEALGKTEDELIGKIAFDLFPPEVAQRRRFYHQMAVKTGKSFRYEDERDGRWMDTTIDPVTDSKGNVIRVAVVSRDITEYKRMADELRKQKEFSDTLIKTSPAFFVAIDSDGKILLMNEAMLSALGYSHEEVIGKNYLKTFVPEKEWPELKRIFQNIPSDGETRINEARMVTKDGDEVFVEWHSKHILKPDGGLDYFLALGIDITERKRAEQELREHRDNLEKIVKERTEKLIEAMEDLRKREVELKRKSRKLEEANIALKVILKKIEEERKKEREHILFNVNRLIMPYIKRLDKTDLTVEQKALLNILVSNLEDITSPMISRLSNRFLNLTPMEIRVAHLVKEGLTNKEIARLLNLSLHTITSHRYKLRTKLGLKNKGINLRTYLLSLEK